MTAIASTPKGHNVQPPPGPAEPLARTTPAELTDEHPKVFQSIHLRYAVRGPGRVMEKLEKAVILSMDRYCGVSAMLAKAAPITWEIVIEP